MKKFKAAMSTILLLIVIITLGFLTRTTPLNSEGIPIVPAIIGSAFFAMGFWRVISLWYQFMAESKSEKATNSAILENLKLNSLPKILDLWEVGTFITKDFNNDTHSTFRFYVNGELLSAVFIPKYAQNSYQKAVIDMGYKEIKESEKTEINI